MTEDVRATFPLSELYPTWQGQRILALKLPLQQGLARIQADLGPFQYAVFDLVTNFDIDGVWETISTIRGYESRTDAEQAANGLLDAGISCSKQDNPHFALLDRPVLERHILPATRNVLPGRFPTQFIAAKLGDGSPYDSCYVRAYIVERLDGRRLGDMILSYDGLADPLIEFVATLGSGHVANH